jgi:hypothetical protein
MQGLTKTVAPCGLVCGLCVNITPQRGSCAGCAAGGGDENCLQRTCCQAKDILGCWECRDVPCVQGYLAESNREWRGMCVGSLECIRELGLQEYVRQVSDRLGAEIEYGEYRFKSPEECKEVFCGTEGTQQGAKATR